MLPKRVVWLIVPVLTVFLGGYALCASPKEAPPKKEKPAEAPKGQEKSKAPAAAKESTEDKIAVVNGVAIGRGEFDKAMSRFEKQRNAEEKPATPDEIKAMKERILQSLIDRELLLQEAKKAGVKVDDKEVEEQVANLKKRLGDEARFKQMLEKWEFNEAQFRDNLRSEMIVRKFLDQHVGAKATVSDQDAKAYYDAHPDVFKTTEQIRASHILVKVEPDASAEDKTKAKDKMTAVQERIKKGEDFAAVAKEVSDCPSKEKGGDLNFFSKGMMVAPFEEAAFGLSPGSVSDIVETQFGYHLIKVTEKKPEGTRAYDEVKGPVQQHLKQQRYAELRNKYMEELRSKAKIEVFMK
ncbi:MAG: peptidylprolyl isomerase [Syntrophobacteraceae bacterium]|nr:peptidylprolyl isomerase [Syntrophobacteraceae bacterium]